MGRAIDSTFERNTNLLALHKVEMPEVISHVVNLNDALKDWKYSLPVWLRSYVDAEPKEQLQQPYLRQAIIIALRYKNFNVLIHRPYLISELSRTVRREGYYVPSHTRTSLSKAVTHGAVETCIRSAMDIITFIGRYQTSQLGTWWYITYLLFQSGFVILSAGVLCSRTSITFIKHSCEEEIQEYQSYIRLAMDILSRFSTGNPIAARCLLVVRKLSFNIQKYLMDQSHGDMSNSPLHMLSSFPEKDRLTQSATLGQLSETEVMEFSQNIASWMDDIFADLPLA